MKKAVSFLLTLALLAGLLLWRAHGGQHDGQNKKS